MSNLTREQIENLEKEGYTIIERGCYTEVVKDSWSGRVKYKLENGKLVNIDSYFGDPENGKEHDRFSLNAKKEKISGHGFDHEKW